MTTRIYGERHSGADTDEAAVTTTAPAYERLVIAAARWHSLWSWRQMCR